MSTYAPFTHTADGSAYNSQREPYRPLNRRTLWEPSQHLAPQINPGQSQQEEPMHSSNPSALPLHALPTVNEAGVKDPDSMTSSLRARTSNSATARHYKIRSALGLHAAAPINEEHDEHPSQHLWWSRVRLTMREPFSEFWGVFIMVMFGNGGVAQVLLSERVTSAPGGMGYGNYQSIAWGWGLGVMLGIYVAGDSGAYLNPAITLAFCVYRGLPFRRWPLYLVAQFLGGFCAAGVVYANYIPSINNYAGYGVRTVPPETTATGQIFCTYPASFMTTGTQFVSEFVASTLLIFVIFALKDESNNGAAIGAGNWFPLSLFFLIFGLGSCFGYETGYALNLARDFGPRVMSYAVGYGDAVFTAGNYYFWVPIVASFAGCLFGGFLYDLFIYTGPETPINSPWFGIPYILNPIMGIRRRHQERDTEIPEEGPKAGNGLI